MGLYCTAVGCQNRRRSKASNEANKNKAKQEEEVEPKVSYHRYPKDPKLRAAWVKAAGRAGWTPSDLHVLCSDHFTKDCFEFSPFRTILLDNAVPTIFSHRGNILDEDKLATCRSGKVRCIVVGCNSNSEEKSDLTFHNLPYSEHLLSRWLKKINNPHFNVHNLPRSTRKKIAVCSEHFHPFQFASSERRILRSNAVPTIGVLNSDSDDDVQFEHVDVPLSEHAEHFLTENDELKPSNANSNDNTLETVAEKSDKNEFEQDDEQTSVDVICLSSPVQLELEVDISDSKTTKKIPEVNVDLKMDEQARLGEDGEKASIEGKVKVKVSSDYESRLCRLCAHYIPVRLLTHLFQNDHYTWSIDKLNICLPGKVKKDDGLPQEICRSCSQKLKKCSHVLAAFMMADDKLKQLNKSIQESLEIYHEHGYSSLSVDKLMKGPASSRYQCWTCNELFDSDEIVSNSVKYHTLSNGTLICQNIDNNPRIITRRAVTNKQAQQAEVSSESTVDEIKKELDEHIYECLLCAVQFNSQDEILDHCNKEHTVRSTDDVVNISTINGNTELKNSENLVTEENVSQALMYNGLQIEKIADVAVEEYYRKLDKQFTKSSWTETRFECQICGSLFELKADLLAHYADVHPMTKEDATLCKTVTVNLNKDGNIISRFDMLENKTELTKYKCLKCNYYFGTEKSVANHTLKKHPDVPAGVYYCKIVKMAKKKEYKCTRCNMILATNALFKRHMKSHKKNCEWCYASFKNIHQLREHAKSHVDRKYNCTECTEVCFLEKDFKKHLELHKSTDEHLVCQSCSKKFRSKFAKRKHRCTKISCLCPECGKLFSSATNLQHHMACHTDARPFCCPICSKAFKRDSTLRKHVHIHSNERNYMCEICERRFRTAQTLRQHVNIHSAVKPIKCDICDMRFHRHENMLKHKVTHVAEGGFECEVCNIVLSTRVALHHHMKLHPGYVATKVDPKGRKIKVECKECGKTFATREQYQVHHRIHTGEKPYQCEKCDMRFRGLATLIQHRLVHAEKMYECHCGKKFSRAANLRSHNKTHTGERPYACPLCGRPFAQKGDMKKHTLLHLRHSGTPNSNNRRNTKRQQQTLQLDLTSIRDEQLLFIVQSGDEHKIDNGDSDSNICYVIETLE